MNTVFNTTRIGLFFIFGVALIYAVFTTLGQRSFEKTKGYEIHAVFSDLSTISNDDEVRMAGVKIGRVKETGLKDGQGVATLLIDEAYNSIPKDSVASIAVSSLLGQDYISIRYGNPENGMLKKGDAIETKHVASFNEVMEQVSDLGEKLNKIADGFSGLGNLGGEGDDNLFTNLNHLVTDNREKLDNIITNLDVVTEQLRGTEGTIGKLINSPEAYDEMLATVENIREAAKSANETISGAKELLNKIDSGEGTLGMLMTDTQMGHDLKSTLANFQEFSEKLNNGQGTLGKLVNDDALYLELRGMLNKAEQALDSMGDSGPISALSTAGTALF